MLRKMFIKKIIISSFALLSIVLLYFMPSNKEEVTLTTNVEYIYPDTLETIYLLDSNDYVARTEITTCNCDLLEKSKMLLEGIIIGGKKSDIIPNGFRGIIPVDTEILDVSLDNKVLTINFSKELLDINKDYEEKMIESIIYTLTSLNGIDKVIIKVEGTTLEKLPISNKILPTSLDKSYGINKMYEMNNLLDIDSYTVFYVNEYNDNYYYVPVTKYINNDKQDKVKVIIEEMSSAPILETSLMSFLNVNAKLLDYELLENSIKLNFDNKIFNSIENNTILEEVMYTIGLSMEAEFGVEEVVFYVNNEEIAKKSLKSVD